MIDSPFYAAWFVVLTFTATIERAHHHRVVNSSRDLRVGMTAQEVVAALGEPALQYEARSLSSLILMRMQPKQVAYGTMFDLRNCYLYGPPYPCLYPIQLRLFSYSDEDLVFGMSHDDRVVEIRRPEFDVPMESESMLDAVYFVRDLFELFTGRMN